jgi:molecular chaperone HtpG
MSAAKSKSSRSPETAPSETAPSETKPPETKPFQAEVKELLGLMIHSLYSHREIFLRELISNASDALDKLRFEALTAPELLAHDARLAIRLEVDPSARVLRVIDNGIGMSRQEVIDNLGTIARSGTRRFLEALRAKGGQAPELIGQFGVGFYASFMVASEIVVETRRAGESDGTRWTSRGDGEYTLEALPGGACGTVIELHLKPLEAGGDDEHDPVAEMQDFSDPAQLRELVVKYSDFVEWPIEMAASHFEHDKSLQRTKSADGVEVVLLNSQRPLWARPKDQIKPDEYAQFYRHLTHAWDAPLETIHFKAEGGAEYTALLYIPGERPFDFLDPARDKSHVALYVRRVFVMADCEDLLPQWLRFVRGIVDSSDLPLNVSREILQQNKTLAAIRKRLVKKTLDALAAMLSGRRDDYRKFWDAFGQVLKEGVVLDREHAETVASIALWPSSRDGESTTLDEYIARMPSAQSVIYVLGGGDLATARRSPHLEALAARGFEALFLCEPIDEWVRDRLPEYKGKKLVSIDKGELDFASEADKFDRENKEREYRSLLERLETELAAHVAKVRFSSRLKDSAAVLVDDEHAPGPHMERLMRQTGQAPPPRKRILELNADHPLIARLKSIHDADAASPRLREFAELLHGQALLAEGSVLPDAPRFSKLLSDLMLAAAK